MSRAGSEGGEVASLSNGTGTTSIWMSILSSSGPEILFKYFCTTPGEHTHFFSG